MPTAIQWKDKGNEEFKKGNHAAAIEYYTYATEMDPNNAIFFTNRSTAYFKMQKFDKSLRDAEKSVKKDPSWAKGYYRMGMALMELNEPAQAHAAFEKAINHNTKDSMKADFARELRRAKMGMLAGKSEAEILKMEGNDLFKEGKIDDAIKKYTEALDCTKPDELNIKADILANRAACNRQLYQPEKVVEDCTEALTYNENHAKALIRRGQAYESLEKYKKALADFQKVNVIAPGTAVAMDGASRIRTAMKSLGLL